MEQFEDDEFFDDGAGQNVSLDEEDDDEDPKGSAFLRGVEQAGQLREEAEGEEEDDVF